MKEELYFISMEGRQGYKIGDFEVREDIPLPITLPEGQQVTPDAIDPNNIIMGMLKVLKDQPENENIDYYRDFIYTVDPEIDEKLTSAAYEAEKNKDFGDSIDILKGLVALNPDSIDHVLNISVAYDEYAQYLSSKGQDQKADQMDEIAHDLFNRVALFPEKTEEALYYLGRFYMIRENYDRAIEYFKDFVKETNDDERRKEVNDVIKEIYEKGLQDENYISAYDLIEADKESESFDFIEAYIKEHPDSWNGYFLKGLANRKLENLEDAIIAYKKALQFNPDSSDLNNELGLCYINTKDFLKAEMHFFKALRKSPDDLSIYYNLALLSYKKGDKEEAIKHCKVILELDPDDIYAKDLLQAIESK